MQRDDLGVQPTSGCMKPFSCLCGVGVSEGPWRRESARPLAKASVCTGGASFLGSSSTQGASGGELEG